jgi:hypothetical protein
MKHVRNFENFKKNRKQNLNENRRSNYYYNLGKTSNKTIFELELLSEGYSIEMVSLVNENMSFSKIDNKIIDCVWEYLNFGTESKLDLLTEELTILGKKLPTLGDMYKGVSNIVDKGIEFGKTVVKSFKDFISNIGNIIKNLFGKIKNFFVKVWESFKPKVTAAMGLISKAVGGGVTDKMKVAVDTMSSDGGQKEISSLSEDLSKACSRFSSGSMGNMSDDAAKKLEDEAGEYKDVEGDADIEKLMQESLERRGTVGKLYYSIKGFMTEGGKIDEINDAIFEAEKTEPLEWKEGDEVTYKNKDGKDVTKPIKRIDGEDAVFVAKDGTEFKKPLDDLKTTDNLGKKIAAGFIGEEPEKKGVFGWLVEAVGFVFNPLVKIKETLIKGGTNGICMTISAIARGPKNMVKYVVIGVIAGLVYHIVHGLMTLAGGGHGEGEAEGKEEKSGKTATPEATAATNPQINLKKESYIFEDAAAGELKADMTKHSKFTPDWETIKGVALPAVGGLLLAALSHFFPVVHTILEGILVSIGIFELVGAVCKIESVKSKNLKVCSIQHNIHHFLEAKSGGEAH